MNSNIIFEFFPKDGKTINFDGMEKSIYLQPLINNMILCNQSNKFHKEGNVWEHTKMCLKYLLSLHSYKEMTEENQKILFLATLLHDVGKYITTKSEDDIISSKGHSVKGARLTRESIIHWNSDGFTNIPFEYREQICNLVLLHMLPLYLLEKEDPLYSAAASSMVINNHMLSALSLSDIYGRSCDEDLRTKSIEKVDLFTLFCNENKCNFSKYPFVSEKSKFRYFFERKGNPEYDYYEPINGIVIIMCGLQASGKDWTIKNKFPEWKVISLDQTRIDMDLDFGDDEPSVIQEAREQCKILMRSKTNFVFNATNIVKDVRTRWISLFRQYKYKVIIYYKERPLKTILEANRQREYSVPEDVILEKVKKIDIPTEMECHDLILDAN